MELIVMRLFCFTLGMISVQLLILPISWIFVKFHFIEILGDLNIRCLAVTGVFFNVFLWILILSDTFK